MTIKIFKPAKTAMQSGRGKTKQWLAEYVSDISTAKDTLMGWNSSLDTKSHTPLAKKKMTFNFQQTSTAKTSANLFSELSEWLHISFF